jgi:hypothetical protein
MEGKQEEERLSWEKARWQCFIMMRMHPYMKQKPNTPQEWIRFPWEQEHPDLEQVDCKVSEDEQERLKDIFSKIGNGLG